MEELLAATGYRIPALRRGQEVRGKIVAVSDQEILIDIGAKSEGIVAGRELSAVGDFVSTLAVGDEVDAQVLIAENDAGQVVLSLRKLSQDVRWRDLEDKKESREDIEVVVSEVNRGGLICEYVGIRGFLPASQLLRSGANLADLIGKTIAVHVIEVDRQTARLILAQKSPETKDLKEVLGLLSKVNIGDKLSGTVAAILPFGIFVEVEVPEVSKVSHKLEGLVHISEVSWEKVDDLNKLFKVADPVEVMVIAKDETTGRLNLSIKQLATDPFLTISEKYAKDQEVSGVISRVTPYGVFVTLEQGIEGMIHISKIPPNLAFADGQGVDCVVESVDTRARRITLSPVVREKPILYR